MLDQRYLLVGFHTIAASVCNLDNVFRETLRRGYASDHLLALLLKQNLDPLQVVWVRHHLVKNFVVVDLLKQVALVVPLLLWRRLEKRRLSNSLTGEALLLG